MARCIARSRRHYTAELYDHQTDPRKLRAQYEEVLQAG